MYVLLIVYECTVLLSAEVMYSLHLPLLRLMQMFQVLRVRVLDHAVAELWLTLAEQTPTAT